MAEMDFASKGVANGGLATGIVGTALGIMNSGGLGGLFGGNGFASMAASAIPSAINALNQEDRHVTHREFQQSLNYEREIELKNNQILELTTDKKLKDAEIYTDKKSIEMYSYIDGRLRDIEKNLAGQGIINENVNGRLNCIGRTLDGITAIRVPNNAVCPGWGEVTVTPVTP